MNALDNKISSKSLGVSCVKNRLREGTIMYGPKTQLTRCLQCAEKIIPYNRGEIDDAPLFCPGGGL